MLQTHEQIAPDSAIKKSGKANNASLKQRQVLPPAAPNGAQSYQNQPQKMNQK